MVKIILTATVVFNQNGSYPYTHGVRNIASQSTSHIELTTGHFVREMPEEQHYLPDWTALRLHFCAPLKKQQWKRQWIMFLYLDFFFNQQTCTEPPPKTPQSESENL